jgi:protein-tyrosine phosphatase
VLLDCAAARVKTAAPAHRRCRGKAMRSSIDMEKTSRDLRSAPDETSSPASDGHEAARAPVSPRRSRWRLVIGLVLLACVLTGGIIWWYAGLRNYFFPDNFGVVEPGKIYRSAQIHARILRQTLADHNVKVIVDLSQDDSPDERAEQQIAAELGIQRIVIPGLGGKGIGDPNAYPQAIAAIVNANRQGNAVLVHCQSGAQRTGGVIATYRMLVQGQSESEAFAEAGRFHYRASQNPSLVPFVVQHLSEWKAKLEAEHVVPLSR